MSADGCSTIDRRRAGRVALTAGNPFRSRSNLPKSLPQTEPDVTGLFAERKDNSVFVTESSRFTVHPDKNGAVNVQADDNGQTLEVVVTSETIVYINVAQAPEPDAVPADGKVQQKVAPGSLDDLNKNSIISAWGDRRGNRLFATVLLYSEPGMLK